MRSRHHREPISHPPVKPVVGIKVKSILPVEGEWFCLRTEYQSPKPPRRYLTRLVVWALVEGDSMVDHVLGIDALGIPRRDSFTEFAYLCGTDLAPNGSTWSEVYRSAKPAFHPIREVTHLFKEQA